MKVVWKHLAAFRANLLGVTANALLTAMVSLAIGCAPSKQDRLFMAIWNGDPNEVRKVLQAGVDPNCFSRTLRRETPLIDAVRFGHFEIVQLLLSKGANPNVMDREGHGPLYYALWRSPDSGSEELITALLAHGASLNGIGVLAAATEISANDPRSEICRRIIEKVHQQEISGSSTNR